MISHGKSFDMLDETLLLVFHTLSLFFFFGHRLRAGVRGVVIIIPVDFVSIIIIEAG